MGHGFLYILYIMWNLVWVSRHTGPLKNKGSTCSCHIVRKSEF